MTEASFRRPKRSLGQNFLVDQGVVRRIANTLDASGASPVLEIGPGRGALTRVLSGQTERLLALEKDRVLCAWLRTQFSALSIINGDGLRFCWEQTACLPGLQLVGNLPYNVASPMIWEMVSRCRKWSSMVFMVQKEVALRLCARSDTSAYGALSAWVAFFAEAEYLFTVSPQVFRPQPKVHSAVVRFRPCATPAWDQAQILSRLLKVLFQQRRKQLGTILRPWWSESLECWCVQWGVDRRVRPENLSPAALQSLALAWRTTQKIQES